MTAPLVLDAGAVIALTNQWDQHHERIRHVIESADRPPVVSQIALAEVDYMVLTRGGVDAEITFLEDLASGRYRSECLTVDELRLASGVVQRYRDLKVGLADASLVVLCHRLGTRRIVTLDERCFRAMTPLNGGTFELLPADA